MVGDILQPTHLLLVLVVALLVLGPKRLPEVGRQLGNGLRDFRSAVSGEHPGHVEPPAEHYETPEPDPEFGQEPPESSTEHEFAHGASEPTPEAHEFAHEASEPTPEAHEFAHDASAPTPEAHEFAHDASAPTPEAHEFAHDTSRATVPDQVETSGSTGEHEFAYEHSEPAEKRVDPLD